MDQWAVRPGAEVFVGRRGELAALEAARMEATSGVPRLVLVTGPPGIGKSSLLRAFVARAEGCVVLRASGDEAERSVDYGLLDQLLGAAEVRGSETVPADPLAVGARLLAALTSQAGPAGLALVLDDVQWADQRSLQALTFALRRLRGDRVLTVLSCRDEAVPGLPPSLGRLIVDTGSQLTLDGLDDNTLMALSVALRRGRLSRPAARRLGRHTGGNPLHAAALLQELDADQLEMHPDKSLPAPRSFASLVAGQMARCSPDTRALVAAMAILGLHCRLDQAAKVAGAQDALACLDQAFDARLVSAPSHGGEVVFVHSLVRASVYFDLSPGHRCRLHARAAKVVESEDAVLHHRVAASATGDSELADEAAEFGRRRAADGAWAAAAEAFSAAGRLADRGEDREAWILEAVECLMMLGNPAEAAAFMAQVETFAPTSRRDHILGRFALYSGALQEADRRLVNAWDACNDSGDEVLAARIAIDFAHLALNSGRGEDTVIWARRALEATQQYAVSDATTVLCLGLGISGRPEEGLALTAPPREPTRHVGPRQLDTSVGRGILHLWTDDLSTARTELSRAEGGLQRHGPLDLRVVALLYLADAEYRAGSWAEAVAHSQLAVSLARDADQLAFLGMVHAAASFPLAAQGDWEAAQAHVAGALEGARRLGDEANVLWSSMAGARLAHARGDGAAILRALAPVQELAGAHGVREPGIQPWTSLWTEALIAAGRHAEAKEALSDCARRLARRSHPTESVRLARLRGLLALAEKRLGDADAILAEGAAVDPQRRDPLEQSLLLITHGAVQRRLGRRKAASAFLDGASEMLVALGATPFLERCRREQAACGLAPTPRKKRAHDRLTPQETAVATLVASGMSNREVADELIVSVKTIEYHLGNIFAKLGVSSRGRLAAKLSPTSALRSE